MSQSYRDVLVELKVISKFVDGTKLLVRGRNFSIENNYLLTPFKRLLLGDGRSTLIGPLRELMNNVEYLLNDDNVYSIQLIVNLRGALAGLQRLHDTYSSDARVEAQLEELCNFVETLILKNDVSIETSIEV